ncbi:MAG: site-specific integrase [Leptospirales bacterium]|nr:site-specific integrase [Leptospirales bacterium]
MVLHRPSTPGRISTRSVVLIYCGPTLACLQLGQNAASDVHERLSFALPDARRVAEHLYELPMGSAQHRQMRKLLGRMLDLRQCFELGDLVRELRIRNYSRKTIRAYYYWARELLLECWKPAAQIQPADVREFLHGIAERHGATSLRIAAGALKFYFGKVRRVSIGAEIPPVRRDRHLPVVLSREEVDRLLQQPKNEKHRLLLTLCYSAGLRVSELVALRLSDLDLDRGVIRVRQGKGKKDRYTLLAKAVRAPLGDYLRNYRAGPWLFSGQDPSRHLTERSAEKVFERARAAAGITKDVSIHGLRHSFATHLHERGIDIRYIQKLLGHASTRTTEIYTHVARNDVLRLKSPLDD